MHSRFKLFFAAALCFAALASPAQSESTAASGKPLTLYRATNLNPDCSPLGSVTIRVVEPPENGRASIHATSIFPSYPESNLRSRCNQRRVRGKVVTYVSRRGYVGPDHVAIEVIWPNGRYTRKSFSITVR